MNIKKAKNISIIDYLECLGFRPTKIDQKEAVYLSPIRTERTASFSCTPDQWYDFGIGKGGNIIDLAMLFANSTEVSAALSHLENTIANRQPFIAPNFQPTLNNLPDKIKIVKVRRIENKALIEYAKSRGITEVNIKRYCKECYYNVGDRYYFSLAFKNSINGYELCNQYYKGCTSNSYTYIDNGFGALSIFEGFFDFLSLVEMYKVEKDYPSNFLILNSTANFQKSLPIIMKHNLLLLFLDADLTGRFIAKKCVDLGKKYFDYSSLYETSFKDLNEMWSAGVRKKKKGKN